MTTDTTARVSGTIRPLVWTHVDHGTWLGECRFFTYRIDLVADEFHMGDDKFPSLNAAKAAAQADYNARILSAIQPDPEPVASEPVATIGDDWRLLWASAATMTEIVENTGIKIGSYLYAHPATPSSVDPSGPQPVAGMRPMAAAPKDRTPILARIREDLAEIAPHYGMSSPDLYAGRFVVVSHPGLADDGFDIGWGLAGPFGHGLGPDVMFSGWWTLPDAPPVQRGHGERRGGGGDPQARR